MGDYHDLYLQSDILPLTDISENFGRTCLQYYKLDPAHSLFYISWLELGCHVKNDWYKTEAYDRC